MLLKDYIEQHGVRVVFLAEQVGVTRDCIYKYMSGERRPKDREILLRIAKVTRGLVKAKDFAVAPESKTNGHKTKSHRNGKGSRQGVKVK